MGTINGISYEGTPEHWSGFVWSEPQTSIGGSVCYYNCSICGTAVLSGQYHDCGGTPTLTRGTIQIQTKPHKCPCCDGWGKRESTQCTACGGAGVLWK
jgi:hypothetical protein